MPEKTVGAPELAIPWSVLQWEYHQPWPASPDPNNPRARQPELVRTGVPALKALARRATTSASAEPDVRVQAAASAGAPVGSVPTSV